MEQHQRAYGVDTAYTAVRRRIVPILLAGLIMAAAAASLMLLTSSDYEAEAIIYPRDPGFSNQAFDAQSYVTAPPNTQLAETDLASLDEVARITSAKLDGSLSAGEIESRVEVTDKPSGLIDITATGPNATEAAELANAYAAAAVESRRDTQVEVVERAIHTAELSLRRLPPGSLDRARLSRQVSDLRAYRDFQTGNVEQVQEATPPSTTRSRPVISSAIGGGIAGLLLGVAAVLLLDRIRPTLMGGRSAEQVLGAPLLASVEEGALDEQVAMEACRARLMYRADGEAPRTVLLVPVDDEDVEQVAHGLGRAFAAGADTIVVDARLTQGDGRRGFAQVLEGSASLRDAVIVGEAGVPDSLPAGGPAPAGWVSLERPEGGNKMRELADAYGMVLLVGASPVAEPSSVPLVSGADLTIVVARDGSAESACTALASEIERVGGTLGGVVLITI